MLKEYLLRGVDGIPEMGVYLIMLTGGEKRLSDFLLVSASRLAHISFIDVKWLQFSEYYLIRLLVKYRIKKLLVALKRNIGV